MRNVESLAHTKWNGKYHISPIIKGGIEGRLTEAALLLLYYTLNVVRAVI